MVKMISGELQTSNAAAKGWVRRSSLVSLLYSSTAVSNIRVKLEEGELELEGWVQVVWLLVDMETLERGVQSSCGLGRGWK